MGEWIAPSVLIVGSGSVGSLITHALNAVGIRPTVAFRTAPRGSRIRTPDGRTVELEADYATWEDLDVRWDYVVVATKAYDTPGVIERLRSVDFGLSVFTQNGLGVLERAEEALGGDRVAQLVLNHGVFYSEEHGEFVWVGGPRSYMGMRRDPVDGLYRLADYLRALDVVVVPRVDPYRWLKLAVNASINPLTALLGVPNGYLARVPELSEVVRRVAGEVASVAERLGVVLPSDPAEEALRVAERTGENISSMLADIRKCGRTEVDYINGAVVELGRRVGVATPYNELLYRLVKSLEVVCGGV